MLRTASARFRVSDPSLRFAPAFARGETSFRMTAGFFYQSPAASVFRPQLHGLRPLGAHADVEHFDGEGERHGEVDVTLLHVLPAAVGDEDHADEEEEGEGEHFDRGMAVDEVADRAAGREHDDHGEDDRGDHHLDVLREAHGGDHGIERENDVDDDDLGDDAGEGGADLSGLRVVLAFEAAVDFVDAFPEEEKSAAEHDEVFAGDGVAEDVEERMDELREPKNGAEQEDARDQRDHQPEGTGAGLLLGGELPGEDGDEDDVVDAEDDLQHGEREEADPEVGLGEQFGECGGEHGGRENGVGGREARGKDEG